MKNDLFQPYLEKIEGEKNSTKVRRVYEWIEEEFPKLEPEVKWSTPLYSHHGTFIIGVKPAKNYFSINPEPKGIDVFSDKISDQCQFIVIPFVDFLVFADSGCF